MRPLAIAIAIAGLGSIVLAGPALRERFETGPDDLVLEVPGDDFDIGAAEDPPAGEENDVPVQDGIAAEVEEEADEPAAPRLSRIRPVAPDVISGLPIPEDALERVEARDPLSGMGRATAPSDLPPAETILHRPVVEAAGRFVSGGHTVVFDGIEVTDPAETCGEGDAEWPCGVHARTALRNYLGGRALTCVVPAVAGNDTVVTDCKLGTQNPAGWLVVNGWARAEPGGPYASLEETARSAGRGLFGSAPPGGSTPFAGPRPDAALPLARPDGTSGG